MAIPKLFICSIVKRGDSIAIKICDNSISFSLLNELAGSVCSFLVANDYSNVNIGVISEQKFSAYAGILGAIYGACSYVPINLTFSKNRISHVTLF